MARALTKSDDTSGAASVVVSTPSEAASIMSMIERMSKDASVSIERVEQAFAFYERVQASQARKAFDAAMAAAKSEIPVIAKNRAVDFTSAKGRTNYRHEDLAEIAKTVDPILSKYGLSYRFRVSSNPNEPVRVTCVVTHADGCFEETSLMAGRDDSGNKNAIQGIGSTVTYLQRYTLKAALGLAATNDDDGKTAGQSADALKPVSDAQADELTHLITITKSNVDQFLKIAQAQSISDVLAKDFAGLKKLLEAKKANAQ